MNATPKVVTGMNRELLPYTLSLTLTDDVGGEWKDGEWLADEIQVVLRGEGLGAKRAAYSKGVQIRSSQVYPGCDTGATDTVAYETTASDGRRRELAARLRAIAAILESSDQWGNQR